jgi:hypothetical protein
MYVRSETVSSLVSELIVQILSLVQLTETIKTQQINETIVHKKQQIDITNDITTLQQHQKLLQDEIQNLQQQKAEETNNFQQHKTSLTNKLLFLKCQLIKRILRPLSLFHSSFLLFYYIYFYFCFKNRKSSREQKCNRDRSTFSFLKF